MASQGPLSPGTVSQGGFGTFSWSDTGNITSSNDAKATAGDGILSGVTQELRASNFGFTIPADATIDGIVIEWERSATGTVEDFRVRVIKGGTTGGTELGVGATWAGADQYDSFGGSTSLCGETWTYSDINDSGFGAALSGQCASDGIAAVDHCRITVYYTATADPAADIQFPSSPPPRRQVRNVVAY